MTLTEQDRHNDVEKAISILEEETKKRIDNVQQRIEFMCASLRAQGNTQISKMLTVIRKLTVEEFCEVFDADPQKFLDQQKQQRLRSTNDNNKNKKRRLGSFDQASTVEKRRKSGSSTEKQEFSTLAKEIHKPIEPVVIQVNNASQPQTQILIDPESQGNVEISIPAATLAQLNDSQRANVRNHVQQLIDQLNQLKATI